MSNRTQRGSLDTLLHTAIDLGQYLQLRHNATNDEDRAYYGRKVEECEALIDVLTGDLSGILRTAAVIATHLRERGEVA